ncbi:hypothetical protein CEXT_521951 [Caerostris extrusa]|uniref:Uncharacterized protein n=1 Tax=Caerostris extrusa TaxID=172846 RepID=A0AAV4SNB3_CAEEX|nr:hypothetical protein CEXT_521951 [Caerostris extrusa]
MIQLNNYKNGKSVAHVLDKRQEKPERRSGITMNLESRNDEMRFLVSTTGLWWRAERREGAEAICSKWRKREGTRKCGFDGERNVVFFSFPNRQNRKSLEMRKWSKVVYSDAMIAD